MSRHHESGRWLDVMGGPHDGSEVELPDPLPLGSEVAIVAGPAGGLIVVPSAHEPACGPSYMVRGFGLQFIVPREESKKC